MKCYLKKLSTNIGVLEKDMYKEIPPFENGAVNNLNCDSKDFDILLKKRVGEEFTILDDKNTPRITYILYDDGYPIGEVMIRPVLNNYWYNMSGNIGYKIRPSKRNMGYGKKILELALEECKKLGLSEVRLGCLNSNIYSYNIITDCGGVFTDGDMLATYFKIRLEK